MKMTRRSTDFEDRRLRPDKRFRSRLKLAANRLWARTYPAFEKAAGDVSVFRGFDDASVRDPGKSL
jgi:hypothetical protein